MRTHRTETDETDNGSRPSNGSSDAEQATAVSAVVVGTSGSLGVTVVDAESTEAAAVEEQEEEETTLALVAMDDYWPGMRVRIVDRLPAPITVALLRLPDGSRVEVLTQPDEYTGYVARAVRGDELVRTTTFVFVRDRLDPETAYELDANAQVFNTPLNLFRTTVRPVDSDDQ